MEKLRQPIILFPVLAFLLLATGLLVLPSARLRPAAPPANLQIIGEHPFRSARISIWVDGDLRYDDELPGLMRKHTRLFKTTYTTEGSIALTIPLHAGNHKIRIHMQVPEEAYNEDSTIEGHFAPYGQKRLKATFTKRGMDLNWQE